MENITNLAVLETKLAIKSFVQIIVISHLARIFLMTTWLGICGVIFLLLVSYQFGELYSLLAIVLLNFILLILTSMHMLELKKNLSLPATFKQLQSLGELNKKELTDEQQLSVENQTT